MPYIQTDHPSFAREADSRGLVNKDKAGLARMRTNRKKSTELKETNTQLGEKVITLNSRLTETEAKLEKLQIMVAQLIGTEHVGH